MRYAAFVESLFDLSRKYSLAHASPDGGHIGRQMISKVRAKLHKPQEVQAKSGDRLALAEQIALRRATPVQASPLPAASRPTLVTGDVRIHWEGRELRKESLDVISRLEAGCKSKILRTIAEPVPSCLHNTSSSQEIDELVSSAIAKFS